MGGASGKDRDDVAYHRASRRADYPDALRVCGEGALAVGIEQAFGGKLFLERLEGQAQCTITGRLQRVEDQLIIAASLEQRNLAAHFHCQPVAQCLAHTQGVLPEQRTANLGVLVLEGEIDVAGSGAGEVGDLAFDPNLGEYVFEQQSSTAVELADAEDLAVEVEALERVVEHARHDKALREGRVKISLGLVGLK